MRSSAAVGFWLAFLVLLMFSFVLGCVDASW